MESDTNQKIREVLDLFDVEAKTIIKEWTIIGHIKNIINEDAARQREYLRKVVITMKPLEKGKRTIKADYINQKALVSKLKRI